LDCPGRDFALLHECRLLAKAEASHPRAADARGAEAEKGA
jgi:hypothetical protein